MISSPSFAWFLGLGSGIADATLPRTPLTDRHTLPPLVAAAVRGGGLFSEADSAAAGRPLSTTLFFSPPYAPFIATKPPFAAPPGPGPGPAAWWTTDPTELASERFLE